MGMKYFQLSRFDAHWYGRSWIDLDGIKDYTTFSRYPVGRLRQFEDCAIWV